MKSPSPPTSKPTNILLIKNLVRPFTLNQIKELLSRTGTIVENGFWMDRIKSKCIVEVRLYKIKNATIIIGDYHFRILYL